jgi:hypothetical protein
MSNFDFEHKVLTMAVENRLPPLITDDSVVPIWQLVELVNDGSLSGEPIKISGQVGGFQFLAITGKGRRRLTEITEAKKSKTLASRMLKVLSLIGWMLIGAMITLLTQWIQSKYIR